jgi:hypothetical protein
MTISPIKPGGWNPSDPLTHTQVNQLQAKLITAVDGVGGGSYTLGSTLTFLGSLVRFLAGVEVSGSPLVIAADGSLVAEGESTFNGDANFNAFVELFGILDVAAAGEIRVHNLATLDLKSGSSLTVESGAVVALASALMTLAGALAVSGEINITSGGHLDLETGGRLNVISGGKILGSAGGEIQVFDAEDLTINASSFVWRSTMTPTFADPAWGQLVSGTPTWCMLDTTTTSPIVFPLPLQPGDTLSTVRVTLNGHGGSGHGGVSSPGTPPRVQLISVSSAGVATVIRQVDDPVTGSAYDSSHSITLSGSGLPLTVGTDPLYVRVLTESGSNKADNTTVVTMIDGTGVARSFRGTNEVY